MTTRTPSRLRRVVRRVAISAAFVLAALLPPIAWLIGNLAVHVGAQMGTPPARALPPTPMPAFDPPLRTAVVVTGSDGAEMTDFLIPYEALATTGAFNMFVVAPEPRVVPLASAAFRDGGIDLIPHYSIDEFDRAVGRVPDVIVIPFLPKFADGGERRLVPWIKAHADRGALIVSICAGSEVLAATGLLDGQRATTHPNFFARLEATYPAVMWVRGVRYVETDRTISSGAIASGMDATLVAIRRLLGRPAAEQVARALDYQHTRFIDEPAYETGFDPKAMLGAATLPDRTEGGVVVYDGISEVALGSAFDTYPTTLATSLVSIAVHPGLVRTRHGIWLLPRALLDRAAPLELLLVPGAVPDTTKAVVDGWAAERGVNLAYLHTGRRGFAYDGALEDIARREGRVVAAAVAVNLNYPIDHLILDGPFVPTSVIVMPLVLSVLGLGLLRWGRNRLRARRARRVAWANLRELRWLPAT